MSLCERSYSEYAYKSIRGGKITVSDVKTSGCDGEIICPVCKKNVRLCGSLRVTLSEEDLPGWWDIYIHRGCYQIIREKLDVTPFAKPRAL